MKKIHTYLEKTKGFCERSIESMRTFLRFSKPLGSYGEFNASVEKQIVVLEAYHKSCSKISKYAVNPGKIYEIGHILKTFYELYNDTAYNSAFLFAFGFHGYVEALQGLQSRLKAGQMNYANISNGEKKSEGTKGAFYPVLLDSSSSSIVTNDIPFDKSLIITGPNASGKTTLLKTALINVILTQQTGCGFYQSSHVPLYDYIHCYLNIPDTSGRDSLFQAEARRCKEIIDVIETSPEARHFCIFDDLYSGTNPEEAVESATAFMKYLVKNDKVKCMLTTHFIKVCKRLKKHPKIRNVHLKTRESADPSGFEYTYKLGKGISTKKGGLKVLRDMNYPAEILSTATF
jgi:DNA mismatch repair ATPase MutS